MTNSTRNTPWFGINIDPGASGMGLAFELARYADQAGQDLIGVQDHPYNPAHLESWTLLSALGARTERVRLFTNVANLPLRPPAMLAKAAATLDLISAGRVELGLGSGALWDGIAAYGGPHRTPGEAVDALEEGIVVMRAIWGTGREPLRIAGQHYALAGALPGPVPAHPIGIWLGALKPRMVRLTGRLADGWSISHNWVPPQQARELGAQLDAAAHEAGRAPTAIRRNYNLMGMIQAAGETGVRPKPGMLAGTAREWADTIARFGEELGMDTFIYWPIAGDAHAQMQRWAEEVVPQARERLG
jgi:alkanesulfonate monooxygenase SsuD/methylene tetrahydromethanopterin reductase-like flavin-dependent oxidoreductase (luciferase family)